MSDYGEDFGNWGGGGRSGAPIYAVPPPDEVNDPYLEQLTNGHHDVDTATSWTPTDLQPFLDGTFTEPEPTLGLPRHDGVRFLYPGLEHSILGETESGKSWFMLGCCLNEMNLGRVVVYIHFEEGNPKGTVNRLRALGASDELMLQLFKFVGPDSKATGHTIAALVALDPALVVLDGVNEGMSLHGHKIYDPEGAALFRRLLIKPFTASGAAVLSADHVVKNREMQGKDAFGSVHKGNAIDGCRIMLDNVHEFGRNMKGKSKVFITKDRPGWLREHGQKTNIPGKTYMGDLVVDDTQQHGPDLVMRLWPPQVDEPAETDDTGVVLSEQVLAVIDQFPERTAPSIAKLLAALRAAGVHGRDTEVRTALEDLEFLGQVEVVYGARSAKGFRSTTSAGDDLV